MIKIGDKFYDRDKRRLNRQLTVSRVLLSGFIAITDSGKEVSISLSILDRYSTEPIKTSKNCKIIGCNGAPKKGETSFVKGFCWNHYKRYLKGSIDILGESIKKICPEPASSVIPVKSEFTSPTIEFIRPGINCKQFMDFCTENKFVWGDNREAPKVSISEEYYSYIKKFNEMSLYRRKKCIGDIKDIGILNNIRFASGDDTTKVICNMRLNEVQGIRCKIKGCNGHSSVMGTFPKGFCAYHYKKFLKGLNEDGTNDQIKKIRYKSMRKQFNPLKEYNYVLLSLARIRAEIKNCLSIPKNNLKKCFYEIERNLSFLSDTSFIQKNITNIYNNSVKVLIEGKDMSEIFRDGEKSVTIERKKPNKIQMTDKIKIFKILEERKKNGVFFTSPKELMELTPGYSVEQYSNMIGQYKRKKEISTELIYHDEWLNLPWIKKEEIIKTLDNERILEEIYNLESSEVLQKICTDRLVEVKLKHDEEKPNIEGVSSEEKPPEGTPNGAI